MFTLVQTCTKRIHFVTEEMARKAMIEKWNELIEGEPDGIDCGCNNDNAWIDFGYDGIECWEWEIKEHKDE